MKAIILAAGRGSRMRQLTDERPKCLVPLQGRALLDWQLEALRLGGASEIAVVTGYRRECLADRGLVEFHNPHWARTNMVSSLACAQEWLGSEACLVSYSDLFYQPSAVRLLAASSAPLAITYDPAWRALWEARFDDPLSDAETFRVSADGQLLEIGQRPTQIEAIQGQYMGLLRFTPSAWAELLRVRQLLDDSQCDALHMTGALQAIIQAGRQEVLAIPYRGLWGEIDSSQDLQASVSLAERFAQAFAGERQGLGSYASAGQRSDSRA
ncbi:phosphocholine cytidylyltransferase family protein [Pseudomonas sp. CAN2814]|jgi:choline kinase|uniref:phosphocholine cytidylyltransferase family protein n=1 Tax=Pseudomonas sp. CAN1 TaxID=3046726 RepID=UPI002648A4D6|nr:phosphocholine cytidylyltransferase family protein [Pseudomonas sp. CAN1]MDN6857487.1 phosphocholine cytidylyltransferase family protein [Pseudomonas sp. CAN1]